ncbi:type 2 isopentenyl-diphosphate Delta-isomerase [Peribacillus deserti]|uniref:Isopentenyl-diphosphate delta-isomerase n=1 Tax=Peribacillus deserti TaxID=673318 RepID=A0A2N5M3B1_9BACI|nr:type 2 isopentenyl-diphosphate Delta-isomerase [Peribacillus deserti]PLT28763.1 type 2 isopentenyl-diphosphate Delta-isomerase [Peribacillus deserti]
MNQHNSISDRKDEHIRISLEEDVSGKNITTGLEKYRFIHQALPELDFKDINLSSDFLGKVVRTPFVISSMTGGTKQAMEINKNLALAAQARGWSMGLGSTRAALESPEHAYTFQVRQYAPDIPLFANLGAVQLNYGFTVDDCRKVIDLIEADALVLHLNSLQEVFQPGGDTNFKGLLKKIESLCSQLNVPVGVKEVGWGIHGAAAKKLSEIGVSFIDTAGSGGTSWSQVEKLRSQDPLKIKAAESFMDWGIPTADCIVSARAHGYKGMLLASGGIKNGVEAAKAIALGANLAGFGRSILKSAVESADSLISLFERIELECKIVMFGIGADSMSKLRNTSYLIKAD